MQERQEQAYGLSYQAQQEDGAFYYPEQEQSNGPAFSGGVPDHRGWAYPDTGRSQDSAYLVGTAVSYGLGPYEQGERQGHTSGQHEGRYQPVSTHAPPTSSPSGMLGAQDDPSSVSSSLFAPPPTSDDPSSSSEVNKTPSPADAFSAWSAADDEVLRVLMAATSGRSWPDIARRAFPDGRHGHKDCQQRWRVLGKTQTVKGNWSPEESARLERLVEKYGPEKWVVIATEMPGRSGKQCRERWHNHLDPSIDKTDITPEEGALIMQLYAELGPRWAEISKQLPGRPDNTCKNYYNTKTTQRRKVADRQERLDKRRMGQISALGSKLPDIGLSLLPSPSAASTTSRFSPSACASTSASPINQPWETSVAAQPSPSLLSPATSSTPTASSSTTFEGSVSRTPSRSPSFGHRNPPYPLPAPLELSNAGSGTTYVHSQPISRSVSGSSSSSSAGSGFRTPSSSRRLYFTPSLLNSPLAESPFPTSPSTPSSSTSGSSTAVLGGLAGLNILTPTGLAFPATLAANGPESHAMASSFSGESGASTGMRNSISRSAGMGGNLPSDHGQYYQRSTHRDAGFASPPLASSVSNGGSYVSPSSYLSASPLLSSHSSSAGQSPLRLPGRSLYASSTPQEYPFPMANMAERTDLKLPPMPTVPSHDQVVPLSRSTGAPTQPMWNSTASHEAMAMTLEPSPGPRLPPLDMSGQPQIHPTNNQQNLGHATSPTKGAYGRAVIPVTPPQTAGLASGFDGGVSSSSSFAVPESPLQFGNEQFVGYSSSEETPLSSASFEWSYPSSSSSITTAGPLSAPLSSTSTATAQSYTWSSTAQQQAYPQYSHNLPLSGSASRHASGFSGSRGYVPPPPPPAATGAMHPSLPSPRSAPLSAPLPTRGWPSFLSGIGNSAPSANP